MPAPFRKANSANDGAEWWIADSVSALPLINNPAIKAGDLAVIKPTDPIVSNRYDIYMYKITPNRWEKIIDGDGTVTTDEKVKVSANDTTPGFLLSKILAGSNITIVENNNGGNETITINATGGSGEVNTASNIGGGEGVYATKVDEDLKFKTLIAGDYVSLTSDASTITVSGVVPGQNNTSSNVGSGFGLALPKNGVDLPFKSILGSEKINISDNVNDEDVVDGIIIATSAEINTAENRGGGVPITMDKEGSVLPFKSIVAGNNITLDDSNSEQITISATGGGSGEENSLNNVGLGEGLIALPKTPGNPILPIRSIKQGNNITVTTGAEEIIISAPDVEHPVRIEMVCNKLYCITTYMGVDYAVEMTTLVAPTSPVSQNRFLNNNNDNLIITAASLLAGIPVDALTYSLSKDNGVTWTTPNANPNSATITLVGGDGTDWYGTFGDFTDGVTTIPVLIKVTNACGENIVQSVISTKKPTVVAVNGLSVNLQPNPDPNASASVTVFATDFLQYAEYHGFEGNVQPRISNDGGANYTESITFYCGNVGTNMIQIGAKSKTGAWEWAETYILVQDNMGVCDNP